MSAATAQRWRSARSRDRVFGVQVERLEDDLGGRVKHIETVRQGSDSRVGDTVLFRGQGREP